MIDLPRVAGSRTLTGVLILVALFLLITMVGLLVIVLTNEDDDAKYIIDQGREFATWLGGFHIFREASRSFSERKDRDTPTQQQ